jgi:hypothetical protein
MGSISASSAERCRIWGLYLFMAFYAMGPGVVVWLALSELMPTRGRRTHVRKEKIRLIPRLRGSRIVEEYCPNPRDQK